MELAIHVGPVVDHLVVVLLSIPLLVRIQEGVQLAQCEGLGHPVRAVELQHGLPLLQPRVRVLVEQQLEAGDLHVRPQVHVLLLQPVAPHVDVLELLPERHDGVLALARPLDREDHLGIGLVAGVGALAASLVLGGADEAVDLVPQDVKDGDLLRGQELPQLVEGGRVHVLMAEGVPLEAGKQAGGVHAARVAKELLRELDGRLDRLRLELVVPQHLGPVANFRVQVRSREVGQRAGDEVGAAVRAVVQVHDGAWSLAVVVIPDLVHTIVEGADVLGALMEVALASLASECSHLVDHSLLLNLGRAFGGAAAVAVAARHSEQLSNASRLAPVIGGRRGHGVALIRRRVEGFLSLGMCLRLLDHWLGRRLRLLGRRLDRCLRLLGRRLGRCLRLLWLGCSVRLRGHRL